MRSRTVLAILLLAPLALTQGCQSLTRRMWNHSSVVRQERVYPVSGCWQANDSVQFLEFEDSGRRVLRVQNQFVGGLRELPPGLSLRVMDFSKVPREDRVISRYEFLIFENRNEREFRDLEGRYWPFAFCEPLLEYADSVPEDAVAAENSVVRSIYMTEWRKARPRTFGGTVLRVVATPGTAVLDIVLVPTCHLCLCVALIRGMDRVRS